MASGTWVLFPTISSLLVGQRTYLPSTDPAYEAGTTFADVDAANLFLAFTPVTTTVLITASFLCDLSSDGSEASDLYWVNLRDESGDIADTQQVINSIVADNQGSMYRATCYWTVNSLLAGEPYLYRLGFKKSDAHLTAQIHAGNDAAGGWGPITLLAYTA